MLKIKNFNFTLTAIWAIKCKFIYLIYCQNGGGHVDSPEKMKTIADGIKEALNSA